MLIRQFAYGLLLEQRPETPVYLLVERLQAAIDRMGVWGNVEGLAFVTGLPRAIVADYIEQGGKYVSG